MFGRERIVINVNHSQQFPENLNIHMKMKYIYERCGENTDRRTGVINTFELC